MTHVLPDQRLAGSAWFVRPQPCAPRRPTRGEPWPASCRSSSRVPTTSNRLRRFADRPAPRHYLLGHGPRAELDLEAVFSGTLGRDTSWATSREERTAEA